MVVPPGRPELGAGVIRDVVEGRTSLEGMGDRGRAWVEQEADRDVAFARYRTSWALGSMTEYPIWLICGFLVPISLLPDWVHPISWALAPTWGMRAIRESATGGTPLPDIAMCLLLGGIYVAIGVVVTETVLRAARRSASLSLT